MIRLDKSIFSLLVFVLFVALIFVPAASAQTASTSQDGWHVTFSPYLWFAGIHGSVGALNSQASVHAGFGDIFSHLNIGFMSVVEPRYKRVVMPVDFIWMKLSDEHALPVTQNAISIDASMTEAILTPKAGYRFVDAQKFKVDALGGIRYWHLGTTLALQPPPTGGSGIDASGNWVDALGGGRMQFMPTPKIILLVTGDVGAGGADLDYQAAGAVGYQLNKKWSLNVAYRYIAVNYRPNGAVAFVNDTATSGFLLGVTWNIK